MNKKLIVVLALAFVVGIACAAYAEVQNVKVGGDYTGFAFTRTGFTLAKDAAGSKSEAQGFAQILNLKVAADLTDAVAANVVLRNERIWGKTSSSTVTDSGGDTSSIAGQNADLNVYLAAAWITLKDFIQEGWTFKIGQQGVKLGSGLIWGDPNTNQTGSGPFNYELADLDPRVAFTGVVASMDYSPLMLNAVALKVTETSLLTNKDDVNAYYLQAGYNLEDILDFKSVGEAYYFLRDSYKTDVQVFGLRSVMSPADNLDVSAEYAQQTQKNATERADNKSMWDYAFMLSATMGLPDVEMSPTIGLDYTRISENWTPLYETLTPADIANALFPNTNVSCFGVSVGAKPSDDLKLKLRYANLRLVKNIEGTQTVNSWGSYLMTTKKILGDEVDVHLTYDYTSDVQFKLMGGMFMPGSAFDKDANRKTASQVIGSMKVTF